MNLHAIEFLDRLAIAPSRHACRRWPAKIATPDLFMDDFNVSPGSTSSSPQTPVGCVNELEVP